jgi:2-dehydropantoate 2-reductase
VQRLGAAMTAGDQDADLRIAVIGAGAVGCYYGARLAQSGADVHFLMRSDFDHVSKHGLRVRSKDGDFDLPTVDCYRNTHDIGPCDLVIIALKATANHALETLIPPLLHSDTMLLSLQNGLGSEAFLADCFGASRILGGLCFVCINRSAPGLIEHSAQGLISFGEYQRSALTRTHQLQQTLSQAGILCHVVDDLALERWRKLVWNVPFNGLSIAAGSVDVGQILADPHLLKLARGLMLEIIEIAGHLGHSIPESFINDNIERTYGMGAYRPSSMIDFMAGRPVEVEAIWGEPHRLAIDHGLDCGRLEALYLLLKFATLKLSDSDCVSS